MHIIVDETGNTIYRGKYEDCKNWLIVKARIFAGADQIQYVKYVHSIADDNKLVIEKPVKEFKIIKS